MNILSVHSILFKAHLFVEAEGVSVVGDLASSSNVFSRMRKTLLIINLKIQIFPQGLTCLCYVQNAVSKINSNFLKQD